MEETVHYGLFCCRVCRQSKPRKGEYLQIDITVVFSTCINIFEIGVDFYCSYICRNNNGLVTKVAGCFMRPLKPL
jgi:hypothetical protein